ncbi:3D domain-containing protein [Paenibacillus tarimensis]|uniref:3D domain-containing protein n=1 Tax=Paenibacillus tarimensis TaxID=416012 RepID=UPI001EEB7AFF|nr:3D domain-containing protein [Paenibacillus tarimensis]MCF2943738.1 LysM peptidoglycan-binding domain-containing protein [Paenibacillus tarimensis]
MTATIQLNNPEHNDISKAVPQTATMKNRRPGLLKRICAASAILAVVTAAQLATSAAAAAVYTTEPGDSFWKLSQRFGVELEQMLESNPEINPNNLPAGIEIHIPDAGPAPLIMSASPKLPTVMSAVAFKAPDFSSQQKTGSTSVKPASYKKALRAKASVYTASAAENGKWGAVDYFGNPLAIGTVAVDPRLIPLGSKLYITGYSYSGLPAGGMYAVASDIGGAIKGSRVDIFVADSRHKALTFGIQGVTIYVL